MVQIWYPADVTPRSPRARYLPQAAAVAPTLTRFLGVADTALDWLADLASNAVESAPVSDRQSTYPVLIMMVGIKGSYRQVQTFQVEELVSHGYVVAALDQPYVETVVAFPDGRTIAYDDRYRMPVAALADALAADRREGLTPFAVVSTAGTTNTGAVDPLDEIADLCAAEGVWHHVDGAYGGFFNLCDETRSVLKGLSRADSLTLDPHKGMFLPYGTGALLVRDVAALKASHAATAASEACALAAAAATRAWGSPSATHHDAQSASDRASSSSM